MSRKIGTLNISGLTNSKWTYWELRRKNGGGALGPYHKSLKNCNKLLKTVNSIYFPI